MTDDEAKFWIKNRQRDVVRDAEAGDLELRNDARALAHFLQAIADRAALCGCDLLNTGSPGLKPLGPILYAARRHMKGEE